MILTLLNFLPYFIIMTAALFFAAFLAKYWSFYKTSLTEEPSGRYESIDGLRGILAFGVFFQHAVTNLAYYQTGVWQITDLKFYRFLGGESVILFFMITSFLYWSKAIAKKGKLNTYSIYRNRLYRLAPMYLFTAAIISFIALAQSNFTIISIVQLVRDILSWLTLGIATTLTVNDVSIIPINAGIHWTLHFEWILYILLPFAAMILQNKKMYVLAIPLLALLALMPDKGYWMIFLFGIAAAHVLSAFPKYDILQKSVATLIPIFGFILVYISNYKPYGILQYVITFFIFLCFLYGNTLWGLLKTTGAKFLGTISYSLYLIHGIILYFTFKVVNIFSSVVLLNSLQFWTMILISSLITIVISALTYQYIEYPFLKKYRSKLSDKIM